MVTSTNSFKPLVPEVPTGNCSNSFTTYTLDSTSMPNISNTIAFSFHSTVDGYTPIMWKNWTETTSLAITTTGDSNVKNVKQNPFGDYNRSK